jgi:hypothetical protein
MPKMRRMFPKFIRLFHGICSIAIFAACYGCSGAPLNRQLIQAKMPAPLKAPYGPQNASTTSQLYDDYRGYVNDIGVQIGRRHFDALRLPTYFESLGLHGLATRAERANWKALADRKEQHLENTGGGTFAGVSTGNLAGDFAADLVLALASGADILHQQEAIDAVRLKAHGSTEALADVVRSYNQTLASWLAIQVGGRETSPTKRIPGELPASVEIGENASIGDWLEDYQLLPQRSSWWFGYQKCDPRAILNTFDPEAGHNPLAWPRALPYAGMVCDTLGILAIAAGGYVELNSYDHTWGDRINAPLALWGGAALVGAGLVCQWQAESQEHRIVDRFNSKIRAALFPQGCAR